MLFLLILVAAFILQFFLPWWSIALIAFALSVWWGRGHWQAFGAGFGGIALGWLLLSTVIHFRTEGILSGKVATLFSLPYSVLLFVVTVLVGGLVGGLAAWAGYCCRRLLD